MSSTQVRISVPANHLMPALLGQRDELLRPSRRRSPRSRSTSAATRSPSRGRMPSASAALFEDLVVLVEQGQQLDAEHGAAQHRHGPPDERPVRGAHHRGPAARPRAAGAAEVERPEALRRRHRATTSSPSARPGRHRQELARRRHGGAGAPAPRRSTASSSPAPRSRPASASASCPATSWPRSTRTCARSTTPSTTWSAPRGRQAPRARRRRGGAAGVHARPHAQLVFIILDEAQNTTPEQMKMFLTRIGFGSKAVVTGDTTQVDVAGGRSGLGGLEPILTGHRRARRGCTSPSADVVRHRIVQDIVDAYERATPSRPDGRPRRTGPARSARAAGRHRPRASSRSCPGWPAGAGRPPEGDVEVFGVDEQQDHPVDARPVGRRWPRPCCSTPGVRGEAELSLLFVDEAGDRRAQRALHGRGRAPPTCWPSRSTTRSTPGAGPTRAAPAPTASRRSSASCRCCSATSWSARRSPPGRRPTHAGSYDDEIALLVVHGVLHVLGMDHAEPEETAAMQARERELLDQLPPTAPDTHDAATS